MNILKRITEKTKNWKVLVTIMAAFVVFATTYVLILPAITLDEDTAAAQGGITMSDDKDVAASSDAAEPADAEPGDADAADADADMVKPDEAEADAQQDGAVSDDGAAAASKGELTATDEEKTYNIEVAYGKKAGIPDNAELVTEEITEEAEGYDEYLARAQEAVGKDKTVAFARFFDITIMSGGEEIQPADNVEVMIEVPDDLKKEDVSAIHFGEPENEKDEAEDVILETEVGKSDTKKMESAVTFETDGFSVYAVVTTTPLDTEVGIDGLDGEGFYVSIDNNNGRFYFKDSLNGNYIEKTNASDIGSAALYYFEQAEGEGKYYIYVLDDENQKKYVCMTNQSNAFAFSEDEADRTAFTVQNHSGEGTFYIYNLWSNNRKCAWSYNTNGFIGNVSNPATANKIILTKPYGNDPYNLDGKSYGILNNSDSVSGTGMLATAVSSNTRLKGLSMTVRTEPVGRTETVFVAKDSSIEMWTFQSIGGDQYYITSSSGKYLKITSAGVSLVNEPDDNCKISVKSGTGSFKNKYMFICGNEALCLNNGNFTRATVTNNANNKVYWMNLAELSSLTEEDFVTYTAEKVSVSGEIGADGTIDYDVKDGDQIVIYTRVWNDDTKQYDYYIMDYDGFLIKGYASGDRIAWVGSRINTMLWNFTEYTNDEGKPTYYYELQNNYTGKYIAPQISNTENPLLSDDKIGLNLNGRRNGQYYTTVIAWDDPYYDYASMYVQKQDHWQIIPAPLAKADTFYFAVMKKQESQDNLTDVETVDNSDFKISVKIQDYGDGTTTGDYRSNEMSAVVGDTPFVVDRPTTGLLERNITGDYPMATLTGVSLGQLFNNALETNHQFLTSTYKETGYFEYDSTQNFAHLIWDENDGWIGEERPDGGTYGIGDFVVYEELGTTDESNKYTLQHGQFLPYNDLGHWDTDKEGNKVFIHNSYSPNTNEMDMHSSTQTAVPLSPLDPRKGEQMYNIPYKRNGDIRTYADHFFGVEMSAKFMQTTSGLDAWGHDLIFEFSGDDDFWFYIDDKLILDLGGIHSALDGSINFRTGEVVVKNSKTNLRELFKEAYLEEHPTASEQESTEWLDGIFKESPTLEDSDGNPIKTVFKDYSGHTMRMFYLERGAGASNLHMRFNLAPYKDGEVLLEKEVSGVESINPDTEFPFQIWYRNRSNNEYELIDNSFSVRDNTTGDAIKYRSSYSAGGKTYPNVFFLKAGQTAAIELPDEDIEYYIVECGMDTETYDQVRINGDLVTGTVVPGTDPERRDYKTQEKTVAQCKKVIYDNHVRTNAQHALRITKKVWETANKEPSEEITAKDDSTLFCFRIFVGKNAEGKYIAYNTGKYHVKNPAGEYCIYSYTQQRFVSTGKTDFDQLSDVVPPGEWKSEKENATFATSPGGAADKIPIGYTVEVPGLMNGTPFQVIERDDEIPSGYNLIDYERVDQPVPQGEDENWGVINGKDEGVIANNQHGYGINVKKNWADKDFMETHDPIYFAVFIKDKDETGQETLTMKPHSLRQLGETETSIRWFYRDLDPGKNLNDYIVYELQIRKDGEIIDPDDVQVDLETGEVILPEGCDIERIGDGDTLIAGGETNDHGYSADFHYTASYKWQTLSQEELAAGVNSKTDTVTNSRPGIKLVKTNLNGEPLAGAKFTLQKTSDPSSKKKFTSDEDGLIAVAYLPVDTEYTLTEVAAPYQHKTLIDSVTIKVRNENGGVVVFVDGSPQDSSDGYYTIKQVAEPTVSNMPTITIKNKPFGLKAIKRDAITDVAVEGISFSLYPEKEDYNGNPMPDYYPLNPRDEFGNLVTGSDGIIPKINLTDLKPGTYYLHENGTPANYEKIDYYIRLIIDPTGPVTIQKATFSESDNMYVFDDIPSTEAKVETDPETDNVTVTIYNTPTKAVRIIKKSYDASREYQEGVPLAGAAFSLYKEEQIDTQTGKPKEGETPILTGVTSDAQDTLGHLDLGTLTTGKKYYLFETTAPAGYDGLTGPVIINVRETGMVEAMYGSSSLRVTKVTENDIEIYQIMVLNSSGVELPSTGGPGTTIIYILGAILVMLSAAGLVAVRRRRIRL